jgi:O-antigen/teichoic acid export membrane protein
MIRSILFNFSARLGSAAMNFMVLLLTTHFLGKGIRGEIAAIQLGVSIIHLFSDLAGGASMVYLVPRSPLARLLSVSVIWSILSTATVGVVLVYVFHVIPSEYGIETLVLALCISLFSLNQSILLGQQRIHIMNILMLVQSCFQFGFMALCIMGLGFHHAYPFIYASIGGYFICYLIGLYFTTRNAPKPSIVQSDKNALRLLFINGLFTQGANLGLRLMLSLHYTTLHRVFTDGDGAVGIYSTAFALGEAILLFAASASTIILSRVSNKENHREEREAAIRLAKLSLVLTSFAVLVFALLPPAFFSWLLGGKDYTVIHHIFLSLAPGILLLSFATVFSHYFSGSGKHYFNFMSTLFCIASAFIFANMLTEKWGINGICLATSIAYGSMSLFIFFAFMFSEKKNAAEWKVLFSVRGDWQFIKKQLLKPKAKTD